MCVCELCVCCVSCVWRALGLFPFWSNCLEDSQSSARRSLRSKPPSNHTRPCPSDIRTAPVSTSIAHSQRVEAPRQKRHDDRQKQCRPLAARQQHRQLVAALCMFESVGVCVWGVASVLQGSAPATVSMRVNHVCKQGESYARTPLTVSSRQNRVS